MLFKVYKRFGRVGLREAKAIACASEFEKEKLLVDFPELRSKALVISPGISPRVRPDVPRDPDLLLYVGRLMSYKGVDHVLRALAVLKERNRRAQLRVVGTGPAEAELKELASNLGLQGQVEFLGEVTEEVLGREYARASCLVLLSSAEAYGLVVAEALASGTPCIVAKLGALTEFTSEPGCFGVESPEDSEKVADLIEQVQDAGGSLKVGPFSQKISYWPEVASRYLELYERILSGDRST
jgi:glycosyltransferase involved in cell wall biosynthesis